MTAKNVDLWVPSGNIIKTMTLQMGCWGCKGFQNIAPTGAVAKSACLLAEFLGCASGE